MKRLALLLVLALAACIMPVSAITLNGISYDIDTLQSFPAGPGAMYYQLRMTRSANHTGRIDAWLMTVDVRNPYVTIEEVLGQDKVIGAERPSTMAVRKTTDTKVFYGGVNGDFFITQGDVGRPTGFTVVNREFAYTQPATNRRVGAVDEDFRGLVGNTTKFSAKLVLPDTTLTIKHVNYTRNENELVLFNQHNGPTTLTNSYGVELGVELLPGSEWHTNATLRMCVTAKEDGVGDMAIPAGQAVLSGHGTMADQLRTVAVGDTVSVNFSFKIDDVAYNISQSIGADNYCLIVDNGQPVQSGFWDELHPRTGFGHSLTRDTLFFLVVDGRGQSAGCNTRALGEMLAYYGAYRAVNWDGGGSSCLYIRPFGEVNRGSDGSERAVGNAMYAVANIPEVDNTIAALAPENMVYSLPRYGVLSPRFLGYNRFGVLVDTDVQNVTLSCDPSLGEILPDGRFLASGAQGGMLQAHLGTVTVDVPIRLITSAPIAIRLDSVLRDATPYPIEVQAQVGNSAIDLLPAALTWTSLDESVAVVDEHGHLMGVANGTTSVIGALGDFVDTLLVRVEVPQTHELIWDSISDPSFWTLAASSGFAPVLTGTADGAALSFTYATTRAPYVKLTCDAPLYSLPDTIRIPVKTDADINKVIVGIRPSNSKQMQNVQLFTSGLPVNEWTDLLIPVEATFGDDAAIFPLWMNSINFSIATTTSKADHTIELGGIRLIYTSVEPEETALDATPAAGSVQKILTPSGQILLRRGSTTYTVLGTVQDHF